MVFLACLREDLSNLFCMVDFLNDGPVSLKKNNKVGKITFPAHQHSCVNQVFRKSCLSIVGGRMTRLYLI